MGRVPNRNTSASAPSSDVREVALPFDFARPPVEESPTWAERRAISLEEIAARAATTAVIGPGIVPKVEPRLTVRSDEFLKWARTNVRPQKQDGYSIVIVTTVLGDLTSAQFRLLGELSQVFGDGTVRVTMDQNLLFRWVRNENVEAFYKSLAAAGLARPGAGTLSDVDELPWRRVVQARGDAVARARPRARRSSPRASGPRGGAAGDGHQNQRLPERLRPASHRGHRVPGEPQEGRSISRRRSTS